MTWPKIIIIYLHRSKEDNYYEGKELGLSNEALDNFIYCCYEVGIKVEVNEDGSTKILGISG